MSKDHMHIFFLGAAAMTPAVFGELSWVLPAPPLLTAARSLNQSVGDNFADASEAEEHTAGCPLLSRTPFSGPESQITSSCVC